MVTSIVTSYNLAETLKKCGFSLPENCVNMRLSFDIDAPITLTYDILLTHEQLIALGNALRAMGEEGRFHAPLPDRSEHHDT